MQEIRSEVEPYLQSCTALSLPYPGETRRAGPVGGVHSQNAKVPRSEGGREIVFISCQQDYVDTISALTFPLSEQCCRAVNTMEIPSFNNHESKSHFMKY